MQAISTLGEFFNFSTKDEHWDSEYVFSSPWLLSTFVFLLFHCHLDKSKSFSLLLPYSSFSPWWCPPLILYYFQLPILISPVAIHRTHFVILSKTYHTAGMAVPSGILQLCDTSSWTRFHCSYSWVITTNPFSSYFCRILKNTFTALWRTPCRFALRCKSLITSIPLSSSTDISSGTDMEEVTPKTYILSYSRLFRFCVIINSETGLIPTRLISLPIVYYFSQQDIWNNSVNRIGHERCTIKRLHCIISKYFQTTRTTPCSHVPLTTHHTTARSSHHLLSHLFAAPFEGCCSHTQLGYIGYIFLSIQMEYNILFTTYF